jgi:hypothetical protein
LKRLAVLLAVVVSALVMAGSAWAHLCDYDSEYDLPGWNRIQNHLSYTNRHVWTSYGGRPYDASRLDSSDIATWSEWVGGGGTTSFNNGGFSPYRKGDLYNNFYTQTVEMWQWDDNGSC